MMVKERGYESDWCCPKCNKRVMGDDHEGDYPECNKCRPTNKRGHVTMDGDVLAGVKRISYCSTHACESGTCGGGEKHQLVNLLPEPAVRKAMVEWIRKEANHPRPHAAIANQAIRMLADRLARGGGER